MTAPVAACTAEPVSYLALERLALGELTAARAAEVERHLGACPACDASYRAIVGDHRPLPPLRLPAAVELRPWWRPWLPAVPAVALAGALLVILALGRRDADRLGLGDHADLTGVKGQVLALELTRERGGAITEAATTYRDGDRFALVVTCAAAGPQRATVTVSQAGQVFRPLDDSALACGNRVVVSGAIRLTGPGPARVCVALRDDGQPAAAPLADRTACADLVPER